MSRMATFQRDHPNPDLVPLNCQVGQRVGPPILGNRETQQLDIKPNRRVQVSREDLEAEADWHLSTFSRRTGNKRRKSGSELNPDPPVSGIGAAARYAVAALAPVRERLSAFRCHQSSDG